MEPSGEAFNAISLREGTGQPANPMINAGAIAATSLTEGSTARQKIHRILDALGRYAGRSLSVDEVVYRSESETGHRNRAIGYMLRNFDIIEEDPQASLEAYFQQCSVSVTCRDLGVMAATLANGGMNPVTNVRAVVGDYVENILSVMGSCGMYDAAGEWIYNVGMPAKSGVAGGIVAVLPGQLGIGVFSPRLDDHGNSVRGIEACREISRRFDLHMFHVPRLSSSVLRRVSDLGNNRSKRLRSSREIECLQKKGGQVGIIELQGELLFGSAEIAVRAVVDGSGRWKQGVLDFSHVTAVDFSACSLIGKAIANWKSSGRNLIVSNINHLPVIGRVMRKEVPDIWDDIEICEDLDMAIERAENRLLDREKVRRTSTERVPIEKCELLKGIPDREFKELKKIFKPVAFREGDIIMEIGDTSQSLFFLTFGKASAWIRNDGGKEKRVATFSPGMVFGEMALLDSAPRSARVRADGEIEAMEMDLAAFKKLSSSKPQLHVILLGNLSRILSRRLREANIALTAVYS